MTKAYMLRTCKADMTSYGGFEWPESGPVEAPDWDPRPECGGGLHGFLWGEGDGSLASWDADAKWLVVQIEEWVKIERKIKAPRGIVVFCGGRKEATDEIIRLGATGAVIGAIITEGDGATVTGGYRATVTGGYRATVTGGYGATVTGGDEATVTGGDKATVTGGDMATVTGGYRATVTGGYGATVTGGDEATVTGGDWATVTGGGMATVTGGDGATVTGGDWATVTGGDMATLVLKWHDSNRYRLAVAYVGENGILPNTKYRVENGVFTPA